MQDSIEDKFQYFFSTQIACLIARLSVILQFSETIGPLIKIVGKMAMDFFSFIILYIILTVMFATVGNLNFIFDTQYFEGFFQSILTVIDASLGNYNFALFDSVRDPLMQTTGKIYMMVMVVAFNILLINLIIAILANTYNIFDERSKGLYLSKILNTRDELSYDECYGAFLTSIPPINAVQIPFVPISALIRYGSPSLKKLNDFLMKLQYCLFMVIFFTIFIIVSIILLPVAYFISIMDKLKAFQSNNDPTNKAPLMNLIIFIPMGAPILCFDLLADCYYFWVNCFRTKLSVIIIEKEKTTINHRTIRELMMLCEKYSANKIKSAHSKQIIQFFMRRLKVTQNLQFLLFGQMIPIGGFKAFGEGDGKDAGRTIKSMRTVDLKDFREDELERLDDTTQREKSRHELEQFNQIKKIIINFAFKDRAKMVFSTDITYDVIDELRRERKILMVIKDANVDEYIHLDMTELIPIDAINDKDVDGEIRLALQDKLQFREKLADKISITRLDYFFRVMRSTFARSTVSDPDAYKDKIRKLTR